MIKGMDDCLFSYMTNYKVLDKKGDEIGRVGDVLLNRIGLDINAFVVHGSFVEEKLEGIGVREDVDEIVPVDLITNIDMSNATIKISEEKDRLKTTGKDWKPADDVYLFSVLRKTPVYDAVNKKIGNMIDIHWQSSGNYFLILGGGWLEEFLESIKIFADKDLIVPKNNISSISLAEIKLNVAQITLRDTITENVSVNTLVKENRPGFIARGGMARLRIDYK